ncbi:MAG: PAS domain S-box protein [Phototrophicaceae bacterium]
MQSHIGQQNAGFPSKYRLLILIGIICITIAIVITNTILLYQVSKIEITTLLLRNASLASTFFALSLLLLISISIFVYRDSYQLSKEKYSDIGEPYHSLTTLISDNAFAFHQRDENGWLEKWNFGRTAERLGYTKEEMDAVGLFSVIHPDDLEHALADIEASRQGIARNGEYRFIAKDGTLHWLHIKQELIWDTDHNHVVAYYSISQDITKRKQIEIELQNSEYQLRRFAEILPDRAIILDKEGRYVRIIKRIAEPNSERYQPSGELIVKSLYDVFDKPFADYCIAQINGVLEEQSVRMIEYDLNHEGEMIYFEGRLAPFIDQETGEMQVIWITRDISERKITEEALRQSEERYRIISNLISDNAFSMRYNPDGTWSPEWIIGNYLNNIGYSNERWLEGINPNFHSDDALLLQEEDYKLVHGDISEGEYRIFASNGDLHWANLKRIPVMAEQTNKPIRYFGVIQDITENKLAEEALRKSEERYRFISDMSSDGAYSIRFEGDSIVVEWIVGKMLSNLGYTNDEFVNQLASPQYHPDDLSRAIAMKDQLLTGKVVEDEFRVFHRNGNLHWLYIKRVPIWDDAKQKVIRYLGINRDITERKLAEEALRQSVANLRQAEQIANLGNFTFDLKEQTVAWSDEVYQIFEQPLGSQVNLALYNQLLHASDFTRVMNAVETTIQTGEPYAVEHRISFPNGRYKHVFAVGRLITDKSGQPRKIFGIIQDITERKLAEEQIGIALREKETLLKEIHHRVKNNLQVISSLLHMQSMKSSDVNVIKLFRDSEAQIQSMALIHEHLYQTDNLSQINFKHYLELLINNIAILQKSEGNIQIDSSQVEPILLTIEQAIPCGLIANELISNAYKHAFPDKIGTITIELYADENDCVLIVQDDGKGLPDDFDLNSTKTLGMRLLTMLTMQIDGTFNIHTDPITQCIVRFSKEII